MYWRVVEGYDLVVGPCTFRSLVVTAGLGFRWVTTSTVYQKVLSVSLVATTCIPGASWALAPPPFRYRGGSGCTLSGWWRWQSPESSGINLKFVTAELRKLCDLFTTEFEKHRLIVRVRKCSWNIFSTNFARQYYNLNLILNLHD